MKTLIYISLLLTLVSCNVLEQGINNNYNLYHNTKSLIVIEEKKPHKLIVCNPQFTKIYRLYDWYQQFNPGDTIILKNNKWAYEELRFLNSNKYKNKLKQFRIMTIDKKTAIRLYDESPDWFKEQLEKEYGKNFFDGKSFLYIETFEDACEAIDIHPDDVYHDRDSIDEIAYKKLKVIIIAVNNGWKPNWKNENEKKWFPWFVLSSGFGFSGSLYLYANAYSSVGSRLCLESKEKADYVGQQFIDLYKDLLN